MNVYGYAVISNSQISCVRAHYDETDRCWNPTLVPTPSALRMILRPTCAAGGSAGPSCSPSALATKGSMSVW